MKKAAWITLFYGLLVLIGGLVGYIKASSTVSLTMGIVSAALLFFCSYGMFKNRLLPAYFGIVVCLLLDAFFAYRFLLTFKFFPAGFMFVISSIVFVANIIFIRNHLREERNR